MGNLEGFDASTVEPQKGFTPIEPGRYPAIIKDSAFKPTKDGTGEYLQLTFEIIGEKHNGRLLWARLNLKNKSDEAVRIAQAELSAICRAVGVLRPSDSSQLQNIPLQIDVKFEKHKEGEEPRNKIAGYHPAQGAAHSAPEVAKGIMQQTTAASTASSNAPAWLKK